MLRSSNIKYIITLVLLVLLQVLILNRISFLGYGVPFAYIYFIIKLPIGSNKSVVILLSFILGLIIDIFCNTPGINAAAAALAGFVRGPVQGLFFMVDDYNEQTPGLSLLGAAFIKYAIFLTLIHHIALISIESFSYFNPGILLARIGLSTILTSLLVFAFEGFSFKKKNSWQKTA
jgi:rod shape-determining protein MreD